jgi:hypothetical protein
MLYECACKNTVLFVAFYNGIDLPLPPQIKPWVFFNCWDSGRSLKKYNNEQITFHNQTCERGYR